MRTIQKILAPIDFTEASHHSLDYAVDLAKQVGASVTVVHVYPIPLYGFSDGMVAASAEFAARLSDDAQKELDAAVRGHKERGVPFTTTLMNGMPAAEIVRMAAEEKVDLIVMGTHGRRGLSRAILGSVAERVVSTSLIPVLTVRSPLGDD